MQERIFREYDIRGKVGTDFVLDQVYDLAKSIAYYFLLKKPETKQIIVGMDGRVHSAAIKEQLCAGFIDSGIDVIFIGVCPSPVLYFGLHTLPVDGGIMITASHNPKEYNGLKMCLGKESLWGGQVKEIHSLFKQKKYVSGCKKGTYSENLLVPAYIDWMVDHFSHLNSFALPVIIDCGNGAAGAVMPELCRRMNWSKMHLLYSEIDGDYPNHEADPTVEKNMQDVKTNLVSGDFQLGIGFDGDADRMAPMTKTGYLVPGDKLLSLYARSLVKQNVPLKIVCDIKSSSSLLQVLEKWGIQVCMSPSGHAIIKEHMNKTNAVLGGELSCHFVFNDRYFGFDDGIYAMMRLFEMIHETDKSLEEMLTVFPKVYSSSEFRLECDDEKKQEIIAVVKNYFMQKENPQFIFIDGMRVTLDYGWGLIRASNTQSVICIRFESESKKGMLKLRDDFVSCLHSLVDVTSLEQLS